MKRIALLAGGLVFLLAGCASERAKFAGHEFKPISPGEEFSPPETPRPGVIHNTGVIRGIRGAAQVSGDNGKTWQRARVGFHLGANSAASTAPGSIVDIFTGENGPVLRMREETLIRIVRLDLENTGIEKIIDTEIELRRGMILGSVKKMAASSKYVIRTPTSILRVRGTEYSISADGAVKVISGTVVLERDGREYQVNGGSQFVPGTGIQPLPTTEIREMNGVTLIGTFIEQKGPITNGHPTFNGDPSQKEATHQDPSHKLQPPRKLE